MVCPAHPAPRSRPALQVADSVRACGGAYRATHRLAAQQDRVLKAIVQCRTAALGGHAARCDHCGVVSISYRSCGNRHCPKCQSLAKQRWLERQCADLLDIDYWHLVFTLPHALNPLAQGNPAVIYTLLFRTVSETLLAFDRNPRWLGAELGITMVLPTWGQKLDLHIHVHCVATGGALSRDGQRWLPAKKGFLFPTRALSKVFRGKYLDYLAQSYAAGALRFGGSTAPLADAGAFRVFLAKLEYPGQPSAGLVLFGWTALLSKWCHYIGQLFADPGDDDMCSLRDASVRFAGVWISHPNEVDIHRIS